MESEAKFMAEQLLKICEGDAWYGDSVFKILAGVTAEQALLRPIPEAHNAWEIVRHLCVWGQVDSNRLRGEVAQGPPEGDWPKSGKTDAEWQADLKALRASILELSRSAVRLSDTDLEKTLARGSGTYRGNLHGALQHIVYHSAQLALLKKSY